MTDDLKHQLLNPNRPEQTPEADTVEVRPGMVVRIRGVSRAEMLGAASIEDEGRREQKILALAMVHPEMTEEDIAQWQQAPGSAKELQTVFDAVGRLSGFST